MVLTSSVEQVDGRQTPNLTGRFWYNDEDIPEIFCIINTTIKIVNREIL